MAKHRIDDILRGLDQIRDRHANAIEDGATSLGAEKTDHPLAENRSGQNFDEPVASDYSEQVRSVDRQPAANTRSQVGESVYEIYDPANDEQGALAGLAELLVMREVVSAAAMANVQKVLQQTPGKDLVELLIEQEVDEAAIQEVVAEHAGLQFERIDLHAGLDGGFDGKHLQRLGVAFCKRHGVVPLRTMGSRVVIGSVTPDNVFVLDEVKRMLGVASVKLVLVTAFDIRGVLEIVGDADTGENDVDLSSLLEDVDEADVEVSQVSQGMEVDLEEKAGESPVIRYVNFIIQSAIKEGASDIHIEPGDKKLKVRFRIDGVLFEMMNPPGAMAAAITSRLKIMANLDISERRVPQDGRIRCTVQGRKLDLRVSTLPNGYGEKTVMRILDTQAIKVKLEDLGFDSSTLEIWRNQVTAPHGIVLVTGPTGSGKTTTLYASMGQLDRHKLNISIVEDPVEYHLNGVTQTQTHEKIGMTFAKALKALLRQDPDVIMLGEIRDMETAHTAIQAALTGHLVLSTLHTNDAPSSITRLVNIGLEPFLVGAAVNGVLAQRLVRRLCKGCKVLERPSEELAEYLQLQGIDSTEAWTAHGCEKCRNTGYSGRVGIYELLVVDDSLRDIIARNPNVSEFRRLCIERGMMTLRVDGLRKVKEGLTRCRKFSV